MSKIIDCPSCGGPLPVDRPCCPHCHCKTSAWRRWLLLAAAAVGIGAACGPPPMATPLYGVAYHPVDAGMNDAGADAG
jgi:hypothetical protein